MIEHIEPKATADGIAVFCAHDKIVDTDELVGNPRNPNKHPKEQIAALAKIIKRQGWRHPIVVSNRSGFVVKGHGRLLAAKELKAAQVPVDFQDYESEASEYADLMADNKIQEFSELDLKMSADILMDIKDSGDIELEMSAFTEEALNELLAKNQEGEAKEDNFDVEAELEKPCFSKPGDIWHLGRHTVICGDSTAADTYNRLLGDAKVNLVCTDPPYMVKLESTSGKIKNDDLNDKDAYEFLMKALGCMHYSMAKDASIYVFYATAKGRIFHDAFEDAGFKVGAGLVWKKDRLVLTRTDWKYIHEPILWGWRKDGKHKWYGDQKQKTVFEFDRIKSSKEDGHGHPSSKPVPLIAYLIEQCTASNGLVLDGFLGSASTLIACEQLNRVCYGIELEPKFVDVAVMRYLKFFEDKGEGAAADVYVLRNGEEIPFNEICRV
ncbi:MAG: ParB N-terminal domain-containing protein [Clostridia bacterium]|nr:ParB N-terminal domain-containing protein [Clostridia bacterium]